MKQSMTKPRGAKKSAKGESDAGKGSPRMTGLIVMRLEQENSSRREVPEERDLIEDIA